MLIPLSQINPQIRNISATFYPGVCVTVLAMRKSGKSWLVRALISADPRIKRILILDMMGEPEYKHLPTVDNIPALTAALDKRKHQDRFVLVFKFNLNDKNKKVTFDKVMKLAFAYKNLCVNIEECDAFCTPMTITEWWENLLRRGRHPEVTLFQSTQTPSTLNKLVIKQSEHLFIGMLNEANDYKYAFNQMPGHQEEILSLGKCQFLHQHEKVITSINTRLTA